VKGRKDAPAAVVSRAACVSRSPPADASRPALSGWGRPVCSLRVNLLLTMFLLHRSPSVPLRTDLPHFQSLSESDFFWQNHDCSDFDPS